jgi:CelD/BcsL family acetyltransferase involved in cellulose biosynthesis
MVVVRCVEDESGLEELEGGWNPTLQRSGSDSICLTWEWVSTWWKVFGPGYRLLLLVATERDGHLCGIAPLMIGRGRGALGRHLRWLMFIGQNEEVTPEYLDFFIERGKEAEVTSAFLEFLTTSKRDEWDVLLFKQVLKSSPNLGPVALAFAKSGIALEVLHEVDCPYADLGGSWEAYLKAKSRHFRKHFGYRTRRLAEAGGGRLVMAGQDIPLTEAFDLLVHLNRERWQEEGTSFRSSSYCRFHRELCERLLLRKWLALAFLEVRDTIVAAEYSFLYGGKIFGNQGGWRKDWSGLSVASVLTDRMLQWAAEHGYQEYDFMAGDDDYKYKWSTGARQVVAFLGSPRSAASMVYGWVRSARRLMLRGGELWRPNGHGPRDEAPASSSTSSD